MKKVILAILFTLALWLGGGCDLVEVYHYGGYGGGYYDDLYYDYYYDDSYYAPTLVCETVCDYWGCWEDCY